MKTKLSVVPRKARKKISFNANRNKVRFIRVPPRSQNRKFWFTETQRIVKKGLNFEVEPEIMIEVNIECRMQITALARKPLSQLGKGPAANGIEGAAASSSLASLAKRSYIELEETDPLFLPDARKRNRWQCVGSVSSGEMTKVRIVMPPGSYRMRCTGGDVVQVFAQSWDIERELI
ncbi:hypothetical protein Q4I28_005275 [Leishmania naiffi]|uniref:Uncharacterized protein n=1 Tax=Leishmania naiffi TaxID=5678 RepID=A0AAW3BL68_9TRYP